MPPGEINVTCPKCQHRTSLPVAAVKRDNFYCSRCYEKVPMSGMRLLGVDENQQSQSIRPKKSSKKRR